MAAIARRPKPSSGRLRLPRSRKWRRRNQRRKRTFKIRKAFMMSTETHVKAATKYTPAQFIIMCIITAVIFPGLILLLGGDWGWLEGWIFGLWFDAMMLSILIYTYLYDPALLAERSKMPGSDNQKG